MLGNNYLEHVVEREREREREMMLLCFVISIILLLTQASLSQSDSGEDKRWREKIRFSLELLANPADWANVEGRHLWI